MTIYKGQRYMVRAIHGVQLKDGKRGYGRHCALVSSCVEIDINVCEVEG